MSARSRSPVPHPPFSPLAICPRSLSFYYHSRGRSAYPSLAASGKSNSSNTTPPRPAVIPCHQAPAPNTAATTSKRPKSTR
eukprot:scaffold27456_cov32-Tisochrysis_lutea.AAC.4